MPSKDPSSSLEPGDVLPDLELLAHTGDTIRSRELLADRALALYFLRAFT